MWGIMKVMDGDHKGDFAVMTTRRNNDEWWVVAYFRGNQIDDAMKYLGEMRMKDLSGKED